jgi:leucyl aminopeptidase
MRTFALATVLAAATVLASIALPATGFDQITLRSSPDARRLIQLAEDAEPEWMSEREVEMLIRHRIRFMDVTETYGQDANLNPPFRVELPSRIKYQKEVKGYLDKMNTDLMESFLEKFTEFRTRYYRSKYGKDAQEFLLKQVRKIARRSEYGNGTKVTVSTFEHSWPQSSIIARFEGTKEPEEIVIIGAHLDSVNLWLPAFGRAPGADDDGSGTSSILEAFRALVDGGFSPERTVEFHWYAAEEAGLLGSQAVAQAYRLQGRKVVAMLQNDMTGFTEDDKVIGIVTDFVDGELTGLLKQLVEAYSGGQWREMRCGYACSDHASWNKAGYRSAFHFETDTLDANKNVHTVRDTVDTINFKHALRYAKTSVGFAVELSKASKR